MLKQVFVIKKTIQDIQERPNNKETSNGYVTSLADQINFLKEENKTKTTILQILSENQTYFLIRTKTKTIGKTRIYIS